MVITAPFYFLFENAYHVGEDFALFFDSHVDVILALTGLLLVLIILRIIFKRR